MSTTDIASIWAGDDDGSVGDSSNSVTTFLASLIINISIALLIFLAFCILRPRFRRVYAPRTYAIER
ncbi:hypothetical protein GGI21_005113, partial [Coemansia aciculifera]